jgi:signal transduction histidine kinase
VAVARRWRIRHKLTLGLTLVVGIMVLLLLGTLKGLLSYRSTMRTINSKLAEQRAAQALQEAVGDLTARAEDKTHLPNPHDLLNKIDACRNALDGYRQQLGQTLTRGYDSDKGHQELAQVVAIDEHLRKLAALAREAMQPQMDLEPGELRTLDDPMAKELRGLGQNVQELRDTIHTDMSRRIGNAKSDYHTSLGLVCCTTVLGAILTLGLARLAYRWIVDPIRDLHEKVGQLAQGNFDSRIEVQSGDEMQDLAEAFNHMTEKLQAIYRDLARQVNERSRQLVRSERLAGVGFLAAGVAHEINNPLASIAFCSEALERRLNDLLAGFRDHPDVPTVRNYLTMIQQAAFRCKDITQKLLEFSRGGERQRQPADLADLIQGVVDMVQHLPSYRGKRIELDLREHPEALVNAQEIKSVVLNLVVNALDSMDEGGTLTVTLATRDGMAEMTFTDTGCGMTPEVLENLFEPFFTRSRTGKGVGLGLSISHRVITQHGGEIEASSPGPGRGSTFAVRLPLAEREPLAAVPLQRAA